MIAHSKLSAMRPSLQLLKSFVSRRLLKSKNVSLGTTEELANNARRTMKLRPLRKLRFRFRAS